MSIEAASPAHSSGDLRVFISNRESRCDECGEDLGRRAWIFLAGDRGALCLACADLDHLVFLPSGDAALTRRARKHSTLAAVVLRWSLARKQYERQGLLVEEQALQRAETECLNDAQARARRRDREAERLAELDAEFVARFVERIRQLYPGCPPDRPEQIATHACQKYSGRVGRSAAAKRFDEEAVHLAVAAHVRHAETRYDEFLARGIDRRDARDRVREQVDRMLTRWGRQADETSFVKSLEGTVTFGGTSGDSQCGTVEMKKKKKRRGQASGARRLQIKTTIDFGEEGLPLERFGELTKMLRERHLDLLRHAPSGFVPIPFERYVDLHVQSNPSVDRAEFAGRLRKAVDARKSGARCLCGAFIWAIGSAEVGEACFTCITGEAWPDNDYEVDEALDPSRG